MKDAYTSTTEPAITLTDAATVSISASAGHHFKLSTANSRAIGNPGVGYDQQVMVIRWKNTSGGNITISLTTGSQYAFRFPGSINALSPTVAGATDYLIAIYNATDERWDVVGYSGDFVIPSSNNTLSGDVNITNANTFYTGASVSLGAGTWLIQGFITVGKAATTLCRYTARLRDTTNSTNLASGQMTQPSQNPHYVTISISAIVTLTATATIELQATSTTTSCLIKAACADNGSGNNATQINALKIG